MNVCSNVVYLSIGQLKKAIALTIFAQNYMPVGKRFGALVWGQSGIGKNGVTDDLGEFFSKHTGEKWGFRDCNVASMSPEDITGIPRINTKTGRLEYFSEYDMKPNSKGIFRIDELDRPAYMQSVVAVVKFAIDRTMDKSLPIDWFVLGLANGISDSLTQELSEHMKGRFCHLYVSTNSQYARDDMKEYYKARGYHPALAKYAGMEPMKTRDEFEEHAIYNNRTMEYANCILKAYDDLKSEGADYSDVLLATLAGCIGKHNALAVLKLHELQDLPTLDEVCANPSTAIIPNDLSLRHKYLSSLVYEAQSDCSKASKLLVYLVRCPNEVARYSIDILITGCPDVMKNPVYIQWSNRLRK